MACTCGKVPSRCETACTRQDSPPTRKRYHGGLWHSTIACLHHGAFEGFLGLGMAVQSHGHIGGKANAQSGDPKSRDSPRSPPRPQICTQASRIGRPAMPNCHRPSHHANSRVYSPTYCIGLSCAINMRAAFMTLDLLAAIFGFALVTAGTPGPNNLMLMASGANFGFRRTVPHMLGMG